MLRDANLRRSKIWRLSILHYTTPLPRMSTAPPSPPAPPANKLTQLPWFGTLYEVLHDEHAIKIRRFHSPSPS